MNEDDQRPPVWVGHVVLETDRLQETEMFMRALGMRPIFLGNDIDVLELRGGTHLVLKAIGKVIPGEASFDLMVDDLKFTRQQFVDRGLAPSPIHEGKIHRSFTVREPAGNKITFNSSHVSGRMV